ncbi:MAG TPA: LCP family protein [Jiangellaceae bacterium]|nr:LCP family protein [Jiangellaceae bacterium]
MRTEDRAAQPANTARSRAGARRARLNYRRRERSDHYSRFLGFTALGSLIPGAGLLAGGRRRWGVFFLSLVFLGIAGLVAVYLLVPTERILAIAFDQQELAFVIGGAALVGITWLLVAVASHRALEPSGLSAGKRLGGALVVVIVTSLVLTPLAAGVQRAFLQRDLIESVAAPEDAKSNTTPELVEDVDPWADKPRVNILLLGGDGAPNRDGIRPDSQILASIDTKTGDTMLFSLPRNLQGVPFPVDSPLYELYPDGFGWQDDNENYLLNAVYKNVPENHPGIFEGVDYPGADANKWAVEGALGLDVDYFVLVNLDGFKELVDALGGITVDVKESIPIGGVGGPVTGYIEKGDNQRLNGYRALWFARSREGSDDYERMERQRCVIAAIVEEADPVTVFRRYQELAAATKDIVATDIPAAVLPDFVELALKVKDGSVRTLAFTNRVIDPQSPDYGKMQAMVAEALQPQPAATTSPSASATPAPTATTPSTTPAPSESPTVPPDEPADVSAVC